MPLSNARSLRLALNEGGVTFVKMGHILETRRDLLPPVFIDELSLLQSKAAEVPWREIEPVIQQSLAPRAIDDVFTHIEQKPLAAASIAQIHTGQTLTDVRAIMLNAGTALMGIGVASGDHRAVDAAQAEIPQRRDQGGVQGCLELVVVHRRAVRRPVPDPGDRPDGVRHGDRTRVRLRRQRRHADSRPGAC